MFTLQEKARIAKKEKEIKEKYQNDVLNLISTTNKKYYAICHPNWDEQVCIIFFTDEKLTNRKLRDTRMFNTLHISGEVENFQKEFSGEVKQIIIEGDL